MRSLLVLALVANTLTMAQVTLTQVPGPVVDCGGEECQSCLSDCSSCRSCRLCGALAEACERKGVLMLGGKNLCLLCSYCSGGAAICEQNCQKGKQTETCLTCVETCSSN